MFVLCELNGRRLLPTQGCGPHICRVGYWELRAGEDTGLNPRQKWMGVECMVGVSVSGTGRLRCVLV